MQLLKKKKQAKPKVIAFNLRIYCAGKKNIFATAITLVHKLPHVIHKREKKKWFSFLLVGCLRWFFFYPGNFFFSLDKLSKTIIETTIQKLKAAYAQYKHTHTYVDCNKT